MVLPTPFKRQDSRFKTGCEAARGNTRRCSGVFSPLDFECCMVSGIGLQ